MHASKGIIILLFGLAIVLAGCASKKEVKDPLFEVLDSKRTGLHFSNNLVYNRQFNLFKYIYFYNGSGVGAGDFNGDGRTDLFFGSNQGQNRLFLNEGDLRFRDVTEAAGLPNDGGWSTGISVVDINGDGRLDIYVCRVGNYEVLRSRNLLLVNQGVNSQGVPTFEDKAAAYGLDFSGFSTQAAFLDYDRDGDLDMFLLNHSVHENGTFRPRAEFEGTYHPLSGDRLYRNEGGRFTDVTRGSGIRSTAIGYGLGIAVSDINLDGYPDVYIGNDFHEDDYLYINQRNGTFKEMGREQLMHTAQFSMGVDIADVNNDAWPEIISVDMLPSDPYILKRSLGEDAYDIFRYKVSVGYTHQYTRNNLQVARGGGTFSETGLYSGIAATDWSWAPLWVDFDNDGLKDLFISNGIPKRMNDIDYINFISNGEVQQKIRTNNMGERDMSLIDKFPEIKLPNKFFRNRGDLSFSDEEAAIKGNTPTFSNGAVYADLDNDGDLDIVVNNMDAPVLLYENKTAGRPDAPFLLLSLRGPAHNRNAVGARLVVWAGGEVRTYEKYPARGFMSSMEVPLHVGLGGKKIDSLLLVWPNNTYQRIAAQPARQQVTYREGLPLFDYSRLAVQRHDSPVAEDITPAVGLSFLHRENHFIEFDREPLIPRMISTEGPALATGDANGDGLDDVYIGGARNQGRALFLQQPSGKFVLSAQPAFSADSSYEDVDACWADINRDGHMDLVVASGGNEYYGQDAHNTPRVYLNDGAARFTRMESAFGGLYLTASRIIAHDINGDGYTDLFVGGRAVPWAYGEVPSSYLLLNEGGRRFVDATERYAPGLSRAGFVTDATWSDLDRDGHKDLLLALEWGGITAYLANGNRYEKRELTTRRGWWNTVLPVDVDGDGDTDLVAGNLGRNSRLQASPEKPLRLYYNDFDGNGKKEQLLTYYIGGREMPFANKAELEKQMPLLKKNFLYAADFARAGLADLFNADKLGAAGVLQADYLSSAVLINKGGLQFDVQPLPWSAQLSPIRDAVVMDANGDALPDVLLMGNYYDNNIQMGRYDADFGTVLINRGGGAFRAETLNGLSVKGQVRRIRPVQVGGQTAYVLAKNNDSVQVIRFTGKK